LFGYDTVGAEFRGKNREKALTKKGADDQKYFSPVDITETPEDAVFGTGKLATRKPRDSPASKALALSPVVVSPAPAAASSPSATSSPLAAAGAAVAGGAAMSPKSKRLMLAGMALGADEADIMASTRSMCARVGVSAHTSIACVCVYVCVCVCVCVCVLWRMSVMCVWPVSGSCRRCCRLVTRTLVYKHLRRSNVDL
jgi:hypothetical protein